LSIGCQAIIFKKENSLIISKIGKEIWEESQHKEISSICMLYSQR